MIKRILKNILKRTLPGAAEAIQVITHRRHIQRFERRLGLPDITRDFIQHHGMCVLHGPFRGLRYVPLAAGSAYLPKLLGSYEEELHPVVEAIVHQSYRIVIDVGCAEGYYAVGLAVRLPDARVYAFDIDPQGRELCAVMAQANKVQVRVFVGGKCDTGRLQELLTEDCLVICDCEGYELLLLCPEQAPGLKNATILVELHDAIDPCISDTIRRRFETTHSIHTVDSIARNPARYAELAFLSEKKRCLAISEFRAKGQQWMFMTPLEAGIGEDNDLINSQAG